MSHGADCQTCGRVASSTACKCCEECNIGYNPKCKCREEKWVVKTEKDTPEKDTPEENAARKA